MNLKKIEHKAIIKIYKYLTRKIYRNDKLSFYLSTDDWKYFYKAYQNFLSVIKDVPDSSYIFAQTIKKLFRFCSIKGTLINSDGSEAVVTLKGKDALLIIRRKE